MCSTDSVSCGSRQSQIGTGFTLVELVVGLALALCLALAVAPLWATLQSGGVKETDDTIRLLQGRVATVRLERDLRLASAGGCHFAVVGPVLEASASQVVFLERAPDGAAPLMVEWELSGRSLMRRWGSCPLERSTTVRHSLFDDNKTMLEDVQAGSAFSYVVRGKVLGSVGSSDLDSISAVMIRVRTGDSASRVREATATARVGR
jgi:hypothetical protein